MLLEKLMVPHLVKKLPELCGTKRFPVIFTTACQLSQLSQINLIHISHTI
jgi:hypothetical protein